MNLKEIIAFRRAIKKFDTSKKISDKQLHELLEYTRWTPSSFGMEPYHILVIRDLELRKELTPIFFGQAVIQQADSLILFINYAHESLNLDGELFVARDKRLIEVGTPKEVVEGKQNALEGFLNTQVNSRTEWSIRQSYIASGFLASAAASMKVDTLIIEGYDRKAIKELLLSKSLIQQNQEVGLSMLLGYRIDDNAFYPPLREEFEEKIKIVK